MSTTTVQETGPERFYHHVGGFICFFGKDRRVVQDGVATVIDAEKIQCTPCGNHDWGWYQTDRPEVKKYLLERGDFLTELQFLEQTRTADEKLQAVSSEADQLRRKITEQNQLIADLQARQRPMTTAKLAG